MCDKAVDNYLHAIKPVPDCHVAQTSDKAVNTYHSAMQFVPYCYKTQETCDRAVHKCFVAFTYIPDRYET